MAESQGFWSYAHADDEAEGGRISRLAEDVRAQFEMITSEKISLFLDKEQIEWGDNWRDDITSSLASIAFFIAVMTPRFFMSPQCRRELQFFARRASRLGVKELILPLHYVEVPALTDDSPSDDLIKLVKDFQWEDWRELRFKEPHSEDYRRRVARLAGRLVEANKRADEATFVGVENEIGSDLGNTGDELPGVLDQMAKAEETLPKWVESINSIGRNIEAIGHVMQKATSDINRGEGRSFSSRLIVTRRVARELAEPAEHVWESCNEFASHLHDVDQGFRMIIDGAPKEIEADPESAHNFCVFFVAIRKLCGAADNGLAEIEKMINAIAPIEKMSRDMRPPLRRLRQGLTMMVEASGVMGEWVKLIDASKIQCDDEADQIEPLRS